MGTDCGIVGGGSSSPPALSPPPGAVTAELTPAQARRAAGAGPRGAGGASRAEAFRL